MDKRTKVVEEARSWLGTRWVHQARVKGQGVDCLNLIVGVGVATRLLNPREMSESFRKYQGYGRLPDGNKLIEGCDEYMDRIEIGEVQPGDVLVFRFQTDPQHFAIVTQTGPTYIIHALAQARSVVEHRLDGLWASRVVAAYRFRNIDAEE